MLSVRAIQIGYLTADRWRRIGRMLAAGDDLQATFQEKASPGALMRDDQIAFFAVVKDGTIHHSIPAAVCMAVLEHYAVEVGTANESAAKSYRLLARKGFNDFIYAQVGYNPTGAPNVAWKQFHDRVSLTYDSGPDGYFSIFKEIASILVTMIRQGANLGEKFIPDISVGQHWGKFWAGENLEIVYGARRKYDHDYPALFPQALSNTQEAYCYPDDALGEFRKWV